MFKQALAEGRRASLVYSVRHPSEAAFLPELLGLAAAADADDDPASASPRATVVATATRLPAGGAGAWRGRLGRVDAGMLLGAAGAATLAGWDAYLCGPEAFMADTQAVLVAAGIEPARVFTESFNF
jgi:ferredoxin-NADP reductase